MSERPASLTSRRSVHTVHLLPFRSERRTKRATSEGRKDVKRKEHRQDDERRWRRLNRDQTVRWANNMRKPNGTVTRVSIRLLTLATVSFPRSLRSLGGAGHEWSE